MHPEFRIESKGTIFTFTVTNKRPEEAGFYWTDARFTVKNKYFDYHTTRGCLDFIEMTNLRDKLVSLLDGDIKSPEIVSFLEDDFQVKLNPGYVLRNDDYHIYLPDGYLEVDITADFLFFPFFEGWNEGHFYSMPLERENLEAFVAYLDEMIYILD